MLGIEIEATFRSSDDLADELIRIAGQVRAGVMCDEAMERWGMVGFEERLGDVPGMWTMKCKVHGKNLYVGQGDPAGHETYPAYRNALRHAEVCGKSGGRQCPNRAG